MAKSLKVLVVGPANCGKTTVARLIEEKLKEVGFSDVAVDDLDPSPNKELFQERIKATLARKVLIEVVQTRPDVRQDENIG